MPEYNPDLKQPPWIMGSPKEVMDWIEATHPSKKREKDRKSNQKHDKEFLKNLHIQFDFDVKQTKIKPSNVFSRFILKITGDEMIEEDFDLFSTAELILRALAKAKFRDVIKIDVDKKTLYNNTEKTFDIRKTIDEFSEFSHKVTDGKIIEIVSVLDDIKKCTAELRIKKIHTKKEHSVNIQIKGEIRKELYHTFLNYLNEKLGVKESSLDKICL